MNTTFFYFLIESSIYLLFFLVIYRLALAHLTHFNWMRGYLLVSLALSMLLPLVKIPGQWSHSIIGNSLFDKTLLPTMLNPLMVFTPKAVEPGIQVSVQSNLWSSLIVIISLIYLIGVIYKSITLLRNLLQIRESILNNPKSKEGKYWIVNAGNEATAFSFLNYIFISSDHKNLTIEEFQQIKYHEHIHANQRHTIDILFVEIIGILFWFSPLVRYAKIKIQEIHEYIADEKTAGNGEMKRQYAQLLFNLASENKAFYLSTGFSGKQIKNRIAMVAKTRSLPKH
ncbi:MAG TPA: M56 family metallopeptidase [Prolixibacteraceae bacterium]|nr:M56 family metallopeptidase [Prolixibacteraceae bacterium]